MSKVAVSFTHIIKSSEPAFSVLVSRFLLGETFPLPVYLSLVPIIGGCALSAATELNFNMTGFMGAMILNLAFVFRNIFSKKGMKGNSVNGMNYYACLSIMSLLILTPFAIAMEGPQMWALGWRNAFSQIGPNFVWWIIAQSIFYHLYNQVSYMSLDEISPLTFSVGNTMKRISVIVSSIIIFQTPVRPINALGAAIAILGTFIYSQFEGAFLSDGKGLNNWDVFTHEAGHIADGSNGDIALDHYNRYQEDIKLMEDMGVNSFRFSISWARILPKGMYGGVNMAGIQHYNKLIDALLQKDIQPLVTLAHYDIPQELEERYGGWLSSKIQDDFGYYGDICFKYFGDRVKYWVTINEPNVVAVRGYRLGTFPPVRCSVSFGNCSFGNSEKEPFIAAHNMILSHAAAVTIYRTKYQKRQGGMIGISLNTQWYEPFSNSSQDNYATQRARSFTAVDWLFVYPQGMEKLVMYMKDRFNNTPVIITENGIAESDHPNSSLEEALNDTQRVEYMHSYLNSLANAMREGADVRGYFAWSLLDNFEWLEGYTKRFGLHYVNFTNLQRTPKLSATRGVYVPYNQANLFLYVASVKVIRNKQSGQSEGYGFVEFISHAAAERNLQTYNGSMMPNSEQPFRLNWASLGSGEKRSDNGPEYTIFVGDLAADVTDYMLQETFRANYSSVKGAKVVTDRVTGRTKGYGFVKFADESEQLHAMTEMNGKFCSTRPMRIGHAANKKSVPGQLHIKVPMELKMRMTLLIQLSCAEEALRALSGTQLGGQTIRLSWGRSPSNKQQPQADPNQYGGYYGYSAGYDPAAAAAYGYAQPAQDPNLYYGGYAGYGNYPPQQQQPQ
ncbi:hypothetical protein H5410_013884 [Solanum commersonii]|uniref:RRM domain-containing protein n=1 Tax=Solanum commersonii TaxID=4109 RepID=A0A9J5ZPP1_SOLCO|nr:hypothetical protein H5410_013884 [Solanum commersonii]